MRILVINPPSKSEKGAIRDLVYGCWCKGRRIGGASTPPTSLLYVATVLKEEGHDVKLLDAVSESKSLEETKQIVRNFDITVTSTGTMFFEDADILSELKRANPSLLTIVFGSSSTFMHDYMMEMDSFDVLVRGEPEFIIRDVVNRVESGDHSWKEVNGIVFRENENIVVNEPYPLIEDLDDLPFLDRGMLPYGVDYFNPIIKRMPYTTVTTSRGCPAQCNFCNVPPFYGRKTRFRSAESVLEELELIESQGYKEVFFRDETFTVYRKRNIEICNEMMKRGISLTWLCNARVGSVDKNMMKLMKRTGCHTIKFGVESGVQKVLDNIKKGITLQQTRKTFRWAHELDINTHAHVMLGCPGDSRETIEQTIEFVKEIDPTTATFGVYKPIPGSRINEDLKKIHPQIAGNSFYHHADKLHGGDASKIICGIPKEEIKKLMHEAYRKFYFRPKYILKWIKRIDSIEALKKITLAGANVIDFSLKKLR